MIKKTIIVYTAFLLGFCPLLQAQYTLNVDLSNKIRPVTHVASGSLYGFTESLPIDVQTMVAPLKPNVFANPAISGAGHQQPIGDALKVSERLLGTTGKVQVRLADILPGWPYRWPGLSSFLSQCTSVIEAKKASGRTNYDGYEIWNEPYGTWNNANGDFHSACWKPTYDLIRSLDPKERIIGPSLAYYNSSRMLAFLTFCKNNNCLPDVICWHQWGAAGIAAAIENYRAMEKSLGISPRPISINEYSSKTSDPYEGCPGFSVPLIAKFERHGVESACISWWFTAYPGRLGSLLTPSNEKGGGWHLYKWYGDMSGDMVKITPPNDRSDGIDGFGCINEKEYFASICVGGNNTGTVNVSISGIPASFGSQVNVALDYVTWVNKDTPVSGTNSISKTVYNVSNKSISVPIKVTSNLYAYRVHITPVKIVGPPKIKITSPIEGDIFTSPATIPIKATASDEDGQVLKVDFYNGTTLLFSDKSAPYSYVWENVPEGVYTIKAVATDNDGNTNEDEVTVRFNLPQGAYGGTASPIPGIIQIENYDVGGNGFAYFDNTAGNTGGAVFRMDEDVDIENCTDAGNGYNIGFATAGEWLEYTVSIAASSKYNVVIRSACDGDGRTISLAMDGDIIAGNIAIPNTGGWQEWTNIKVNDVQLEAGEHVLRLSIGDVDYVNLNYIGFEAIEIHPVVNITFPENKGTFLSNEPVTITATATSENASIVSVRYYANGVLLGANNSSPYSYIWENMAEGDYILKVEAENNSGLISSELISVTINKAPEAISLKTGWNLIGCPLSGSTAVENALSGIWDKVETVKDMDVFYNVAKPTYLNSLHTLDWGMGYLLKVNADCELLWDNK